MNGASSPSRSPRVPDVRPPWRRALAWLAFLGPFFFLTYGFANWLAARRSDVGAVVFDWEGSIPFLAWSIVPYWSIDFFYVASLFVCRTGKELDTHARRLLAAQVICVAFFLAAPLTFTFERPVTVGVFGWMFDVLAGFDKPFNQAPSLHIALLVILWVLYRRHLHGAWRVLLHAWFILIGVSVLTTYQHHFLDVPTGMLVGWLCVWLLPDADRAPLRLRFAGGRDRRLGWRYAGGALGVAGLSLLLGGWALWLWWIAVALAIVAAGYLALGESAFQKGSDGSLSLASNWLLAPYLAGAWLNSRWWTRACPDAAPVAPGILIGRIPAPGDCDRHGIGAVVDLCAELPCRAGAVKYTSVPQLDLTTASLGQLRRASEAIERATAEGTVLVCCALGFSRSAVAVAAWLLATGRAAGVAAAVEQVRRARPQAVINRESLAALERFAA